MPAVDASAGKCAADAANLNVPNETNLIMPVDARLYLIREFERNVQDFAADVEGRPLNGLGQIRTPERKGRRRATMARFHRVYANEFQCTNELNRSRVLEQRGFVDVSRGAISSLHSARRSRKRWKVATFPSTNTFAKTDILYTAEVNKQVGGVPHRIVIDGEGNYDPQRMRADVQKIVEAEVSMFGGIPYHDYTFILHLRSNTGGGLEHLNSTALGFRRFNFATERGWQSFYGLVAHEFFHLWNVKRIRPDVLGPFDYTKENYTRLLWVAEGITSYYGNLMVRRAGLNSERGYLDALAKGIQDFQDTPGRLAIAPSRPASTVDQGVSAGREFGQLADFLLRQGRAAGPDAGSGNTTPVE
jgi:predicted metalloprotease with PDZ domain